MNRVLLTRFARFETTLSVTMQWTVLNERAAITERRRGNVLSLSSETTKWLVTKCLSDKISSLDYQKGEHIMYNCLFGNVILLSETRA